MKLTVDAVTKGYPGLAVLDDVAFDVAPGEFDRYGEVAREKGFSYVASGPLVRSSYHAADFHPLGKPA